MVNIFYYIGFICLASCLEEIFNNKRRKEYNVKLKDAYDTTIESTALYGVSKVPIKNILSKTAGGLRWLVGFITLGWNITGIVISEQRHFFILLFCISLIPITLFIKDEKKQIQIMLFDSVVSLVLVSVILYNYFFNNVLV